MNIRCQMETISGEGPGPAPALASTSVVPPIPKVAVVRL